MAGTVVRHLGLRRLASSGHPRRARRGRAARAASTSSRTASCGRRRSPATCRCRAVPGGSVIDGEGGDEVLGVAAHRIAPVDAAARAPATVAAAPCRVRRVERCRPGCVRAPHDARRLERDADCRGCDRPAGTLLLAALDDASERGRRSRSPRVSMVPRRRTQVLAARTGGSSPARWRRGVEPTAPPRLRPRPRPRRRRARAGRPTAVLRGLVPDLLPDDVLARTSKATFNDCYMGRHTREFAARWDGDGRGPRAGGPRRAAAVVARRAASTASTAALLQQAWLATAHRVRQRCCGRPPTVVLPVCD